MSPDRRLSSLSLAVGILISIVFVVRAAPAAPVSEALPQGIDVLIEGPELCPQSVCGAAIFIGGFRGRVDWNPSATGLFWTAVNHEPLPTVLGGSSDLIPNTDRDVDWALWGLPSHEGKVEGGALTCVMIDPANGNACVVFAIVADLSIHGGGTACFKGYLDHRPLYQNPKMIPKVYGSLSTECP
jgi:hypothetical protein